MVTVHTPSTASDRSPSTNHPTANYIQVKDGHLFVQEDSNTVAIYAPGKWVNAVVG